MASNLWGQMPESHPRLTKSINREDKQSQCVQNKQSVKFCLETPGLYQPDEKLTKFLSRLEDNPSSHAMDPRVVHTIQLLYYTRKIRSLINSWHQQQQSKPGESSSTTLSLTPLTSFPEYPDTTTKMHHPNDDIIPESDVADRMFLSPSTCQALLRRSVAGLFCHVGYESMGESLLVTMTDIAAMYLTQICNHLRNAQDHQLQHGSSGFPDVIERVMHQIGVGSVTSLHDFYQSRVVRYHDETLQLAQMAAAEYDMLQSTAPAVDLQPETFTLIKIKDEPYSSDIQFPNLDETEDMDPDQMIQLEGLGNFEIIVEQESVTGLTMESDPRWAYSIKSEPSSSGPVDQGQTLTGRDGVDVSQPLSSSTSNPDLFSPASTSKYSSGTSKKRKKRSLDEKF